MWSYQNLDLAPSSGQNFCQNFRFFRSFSDDINREWPLWVINNFQWVRNGHFQSFSTITDDFEKKVENFRQNWRFSDDSALLKGMQHVMPKPAQVIFGIKMFVKTRATILAILNALGQWSWLIAANLVKNIDKIRPLVDKIFQNFFLLFSFFNSRIFKRSHL